MDDLQFRRHIYANPFCNDEDVKKAAAEDASKHLFWSELKRLECSIQAASKVAVPESLGARLILRQSIESHQSRKVRSRWQLATAASIAFAVGVTFTLWQQSSFIDLGQHALTHINHEADGFALKVDGNVDLGTVNAKLASFGTRFTDHVSRIYFAGFCNFGGVRSFHMVMEGENGRVTVFVVPQNTHHKPVDSFSDGIFQGETLELDRARLILVGEEGKPFDNLKQKLEKSVVFSA